MWTNERISKPPNHWHQSRKDEAHKRWANQLLLNQEQNSYFERADDEKLYTPFISFYLIIIW
jgi:hypothetical protein